MRGPTFGSTREFVIAGLLLGFATACGGGSSSSTPAGPFRVEAVLPANGAAGISVNGTIQVTFNQGVSGPTVQNGVTFSLTETSSPATPLAGSLTLDGSGRVLTFLPSSSLVYGGTYEVDLTSGIENTGGAALDIPGSAVPIPSTFQTLANPDTIAPTFGGATGAAGLDNSSIQVDWNPATDDVDPPAWIVYNVYLSLVSGGQNFATPDVTSPAGATSEIVGGLAPSTTYYVVVRAEDTSGNEDTNVVEVSASTTASSDMTPPIFGGATGASALGSNSVQVDWAAASDDTDPPSGIVYNVYAATLSGGQNFATPDVTSPAGATSEIVGGLAPLTTYYIVVRAEDTSGNEDANLVEVSATTTAGPDLTPPVFGGATGATPLGNTSIQVDWLDASDNVDLPSAIIYNVYVAITPGGQNFATPDVTSPAGATSQVVGSLSPGTTYYVVVRAEDTSGNEDANVVEVSATTTASGDITPPIFAGATGAVPIDGTTIQVNWLEAIDDTDPQNAIIYNIYVATVSGGQNFASPDVTSVPGAVSEQIGGLTPGATYFFVVRAEDTSGNEETNVVEVVATTIVSYAADVQPIFTMWCASGNCHNPPGPRRNLDLSDYAAVNSTAIGIVSGQAAPMNFIEPFDSANSYLMHKIDGTHGSVGGAGGQMPVGSQAEADLVRAWIDQGAQNN